jgi:diguanylate cyclase (GGDEF)-like protein
VPDPVWRAAAAVLAGGGSGPPLLGPVSPAGAAAGLCEALVPIASAGQVLAILWLDRRGPGPELQLLEGLACHAAVAFANARELHLRAEHDGLTGIANHGRFWRVLEREVARSQRYGSPLGVVMLDLDDFKGYNDALGHLAGDRALRAVAEGLAKTSRTSDTVARYGGEEFAVVLPQTSLAGGFAFARKALEVVRELGLVRPDGSRLTLAAGAAELQPQEDSRSLVRRADAELYRAKRQGGDCVCPGPPGPQ